VCSHARHTDGIHIPIYRPPPLPFPKRQAPSPRRTAVSTDVAEAGRLGRLCGRTPAVPAALRLLQHASAPTSGAPWPLSQFCGAPVAYNTITAHAHCALTRLHAQASSHRGTRKTLLSSRPRRRPQLHPLAHSPPTPCHRTHLSVLSVRCPLKHPSHYPYARRLSPRVQRVIYSASSAKTKAAPWQLEKRPPTHCGPTPMLCYPPPTLTS